MEGLDALYDQTRQELGARRGWQLQPKPFNVQFRRYAGLNARIWDRRTHYDVRLSELLQSAPTAVHASLARILIGKIDRRLPTNPRDALPYRLWARSPEIDARHQALRRIRGRKKLLHPRGRVHDLESLFHRLNVEYFGGRLSPPRLGWSPGFSRSLYGHHDAAHDAIVINRVLDHPRVPEYVTASILHHELLHTIHPVRYTATGRRLLHTREFRRDERRFSHHEAAQAFLKDLARTRIRISPPG